MDDKKYKNILIESVSTGVLHATSKIHSPLELKTLAKYGGDVGRKIASKSNKFLSAVSNKIAKMEDEFRRAASKEGASQEKLKAMRDTINKYKVKASQLMAKSKHLEH